MAAAAQQFAHAAPECSTEEEEEEEEDWKLCAALYIACTLWSSKLEAIHLALQRMAGARVVTDT